MLARFHHFKDPSKRLEIGSLACAERVLVEEWDDATDEIPSISDP